MRSATCWVVATNCVLCGMTTTLGAAIDFEAPTFVLGTQYGTPAGHVPGDVVFNVWDVETSVRDFHEGAFVGFSYAEIAGHPGPPTSFFPPAVNPTQVLQISNINMAFDFRGVPGEVTGVRFDYVDLGGTENFDLNMTGLQEVPQLIGIVAPPGFSINVTQNFFIGSNHWGRVTIEADPGNKIETLVIGGQEFAIDNLEKRLAASADFDQDGDVDGDDFLKWQASFLVDNGGDADGDGDTDGDDFLLWQTQFGGGDGGASRVVPEPLAARLLVILALLMSVRFRRR